MAHVMVMRRCVVALTTPDCEKIITKLTRYYPVDSSAILTNAFLQNLSPFANVANQKSE
jgi:hypothetical protein